MTTVVREHEIPHEIERTLDSNYTSEYHLEPAGSTGWKFDRKQFSSVEIGVVEDVEKLFKTAQRWKAEAIALSWGVRHESSSKQVTVATFTVGLHAEGCVPIHSEGIWFWNREHLVLPETVANGTNFESGHPSSYRRSSGVRLKAEQTIGPFGINIYPLKLQTPYSIREVILRPFTYSDVDRSGLRKFTGEDVSRMLLEVELEDGRHVIINRMSEKLATHNSEQLEAQRRLEEAQKRVDELAGVSKEALVGSDETELAYLNSLSDPLKHSR